MANATGCSSIYGGNLPTTPWTKNAAGLGPAWSNSLFEDNAEFGLGFRVSLDKQREFAREQLELLSWAVGEDLARRILANQQINEADIFEQREAVAELKQKLEALNSDEARRLLGVADALARKSVWVIGGDGWAYDIGYGGLDHVLASGRNVKVLVLDTEVYSNTGGQMSKATPRGAVAKFAAGGKPAPKKDLGLIAMTYGNVYVARSRWAQRRADVKAFWKPKLTTVRPSSSPAIASRTASNGDRAANQKRRCSRACFTASARIGPRGENPLQLDSQAPKMKVQEYLNMENRFRMLARACPSWPSNISVKPSWTRMPDGSYSDMAARRSHGNGKPARRVRRSPRRRPRVNSPNARVLTAELVGRGVPQRLTSACPRSAR